MNNLNRNLVLDYTKFIAIILVIIGHSIQFNNSNYENSYFYNLIYSFHMPLFMFISGYVSFNSIKKNKFNKFIKQKFISLLYPYVLFSLFYVYFFNKATGFFVSLSFIFHFPGEVYWFLYVLFVLNILFYFLFFIYQKNSYIALIIYLSILLIPSYDFGLSLIKNMSIYFLLGMIIYRFRQIIIHFLLNFSTKINFILLTIFFILSGYYYHKNNVYYYDMIETSNIFAKFLVLSVKFLMANVGILFSIWMARLMSSINYNFFMNIGARYTLQLYILHYYFLTLVQTKNIFLNECCSATISFFMSLVLIKFFEKLNLNKYMFGR